jgi:predicted AlkP superfamily phosphohydrolase/phosphomutase
MFWRFMDKQSPLYDEKLAAEYGNAVENIYVEADWFLDKALQKADKDTVIMVLSDHGFAPFRRSFNVNTWLRENGYIHLINPWEKDEEGLHLNTDWTRTKAYVYGMNSLYVNERNREREGIVSPGAEKENLLHEIARKLESYKDPQTGEHPIYKAALAREIYSGAHLDKAPDLVLGYNLGYRVSWETPLGKIPEEIITDNTEKWSGDHMSSPQVVPGILFMNRKIQAVSPALYDLTPTILKIFGIQKPDNMIGQAVL